jgi:hypothetical protein
LNTRQSISFKKNLYRGLLVCVLVLIEWTFKGTE